MPSRNFTMEYESKYDLKIQIRSLTATIAQKDVEIERLREQTKSTDKLLSLIGTWLYKRNGMEEPMWIDEYKSVKQALEEEK